MEQIYFESGGMLGFPIAPSLVRLTEAKYIVLQIPSFAAKVVAVPPVLLMDSVRGPQVIWVSKWKSHVDLFRCSLGRLYALQRVRVVIDTGSVDSVQAKDQE